MNKLIKIISTLLLAFVLSSLLLFRARLGDTPALPPKDAQRTLQSDIKTVEGQIGFVDTVTNTLTLIEGSQQVTFIFDARTAIVASGHTVEPNSLQQGASATVKYTQRGGKNWARKIELRTDTY